MIKKTKSISELSDDLSYEGVTAMKECFNLMDTNGDGELSQSELAQVMQSLGIHHSKEEIAVLFHELDTDKSNSISFQEFLGGLRWSSRSNKMTEKSKMSEFFQGIDPTQLDLVKQVFQDLDTDGDGYITRAELYSMMTQLKLDPSAEDFDNLFNSLDLNGDGKIELEEFMSAVGWLRKGLVISSKLSTRKVASGLSEDKRTIQSLQEKKHYSYELFEGYR